MSITLTLARLRVDGFIEFFPAQKQIAQFPVGQASPNKVLVNLGQFRLQAIRIADVLSWVTVIGFIRPTAAMLRASSSTFLCWVSRRPGLILISLILIFMLIVLNAKIRQ